MSRCHKCGKPSVCSVGPQKLEVCQLHFEKYLQAARTAARKLFGLSPA